MKLLIRAAMILVALAAAALSFQSLMHLGELCGYGGLSWLYPVVVDLGAAASCVVWLHERKRQALWMCWGFIGVSVILNGTVHYLTSTGIPPGWLLVVLVAAVPPATFGLVVHLGWTAAPAAEPHATAPDRTDDELVSVVAAYIAEHGPTGRNVLSRELGITTHQARLALAATNGGQPARKDTTS